MTKHPNFTKYLYFKITDHNIFTLLKLWGEWELRQKILFFLGCHLAEQISILNHMSFRRMLFRIYVYLTTQRVTCVVPLIH